MVLEFLFLIVSETWFDSCLQFCGEPQDPYNKFLFFLASMLDYVMTSWLSWELCFLKSMHSCGLELAKEELPRDWREAKTVILGREAWSDRLGSCSSPHCPALRSTALLVLLAQSRPISLLPSSWIFGCRPTKVVATQREDLPIFLSVSSLFTVPLKQPGIAASQISLQAPTYPLIPVLLGDLVRDSFSCPLIFASLTAPTLCKV